MKNKQNKQNNSFPKERSSSKERKEQNQKEAQASLNALKRGLKAGDKTE